MKPKIQSSMIYFMHDLFSVLSILCMMLLFLSSGGTSTGADVAGYVANWLCVFVFRKNWVRDC